MSKTDIALLTLKFVVELFSHLFLFGLAVRYRLKWKSIASFLLAFGLALIIPNIIFAYFREIDALSIMPGNIVREFISDEMLYMMRKVLQYDVLYPILLDFGYYLLVAGFFIGIQKLHIAKSNVAKSLT